jgi:hypothetical protein
MKHVQESFSNDWEKKLMEDSFHTIDSINKDDLSFPGFYCIRLRPGHTLPQRYQQHLKPDRLLYIGKASGQTLKKRFYDQELNAIGHGTYFRSIGAVLGYRPPKGSLADKANKNNYTFSEQDERSIIDWMRQSLEVNWVAYEGNFDVDEPRLIQKYCPLLNIENNPCRLVELKGDRNECRKIARTIS